MTLDNLKATLQQFANQAARERELYSESFEQNLENLAHGRYIGYKVALDLVNELEKVERTGQ